MSEQIEFVKEIARRLDSAAIEYMFTGSIVTTCHTGPTGLELQLTWKRP